MDFLKPLILVVLSLYGQGIHLRESQATRDRSMKNFIAKGGFFSESGIRFSDLQISKKNIPKNYPELEI